MASTRSTTRPCAVPAEPAEGASHLRTRAPSLRAAMGAERVLEVERLVVEYPIGDQVTRAVDGVSLDVASGEFLAIVGESGCGKSTLLFAIARLLTPPAEVVSGRVHFEGRNLVSLDANDLRKLRWVEYSVVLQSAMNALNPVLT